MTSTSTSTTTTTTTTSPDTWASPNNARNHFAARLSHEADVSDVAAALDDGSFVLVDVRSTQAWDAGHVPGAIHLPRADIRPGILPAGVRVVTYCWGPGCNGATRAALELARLGHEVKEMIGGFEYWVREGLPVQTPDGVHRGRPDPLTAPAALACAC